MILEGLVLGTGVFQRGERVTRTVDIEGMTLTLQDGIVTPHKRQEIRANLYKHDIPSKNGTFTVWECDGWTPLSPTEPTSPGPSGSGSSNPDAVPKASRAGS